MNCFEKLVFGLFEFVYIISALIIFSLGASLLGVSLYYSLDNTYYNVGEIISDAFQAYVDTSNNSYNYYWIYYVCYAFAGWMMVSGFFGCFGACGPSKSCKLCSLFVFFLMNLIIVAGACIVLGFNFGLTNNLDATLYDVLSNYTLDSSADYTLNFESYEQDNTCCGLVNQDQSGTPLNTCYQWGANQIPLGCNCTVNSNNNNCITTQQAETNYTCAINNDFTGVYANSCFDSLKNDAKTIYEALGITLCVTAGITFLAVILSMTLYAFETGCCGGRRD